MSLKTLLKENEVNINEYEKFFDNSFQNLKELNFVHKIIPPKPPEISEIHINSKKFPLDLHLDEHIRSFLKSGVLRPFENTKNEAYFDELFQSKLIKTLIERLLIIVFISKFPEENEILDNLRIKLNKSINRKYSQIFVKSPKPKDEFLNYVTFSIGYIIHMIFFLIFPINRQFFDIRFIFDVYHIVIFHINGLFISDYYLQTQFERIFTGKFLDYEFVKTTISKKEDETEALKNQSFSLEKSFIIKGSINESKYHDLAGELSNRLKIKQKFFRRRDSEKSITSNFAKRSANSPIKAVYIDENEAVSERMRFNCFQVSPCISSIINAPLLPHTKTKTINYSLDKSYLNRTRSFVQLYEIFQKKLQYQTKKPSKSLPKISSFHSSNANFINENVKIDNLEKAKKLFKHMKDLSLSLKKQEQRFSTLNSSKIILENAKKRSFLNEKIFKEVEEEKKRTELEQQTIKEESKNKYLKIGLMDVGVSTRNINNKDGSTQNMILKNQLSGLLRPPDYELAKNISFKRSKSNNMKVVPDKEVQRIFERLNAKVYEKGEVIDINEGLKKNKVQIYTMLNYQDDNILEGKDRKKEYINKYAKLVNESIDENIKGINLKLATLKKAHK